MDGRQRHVKSQLLTGLVLLFLCAGTSLAEPSTKEIPEEEGTSIFFPTPHNLFLNNQTSLDLIYPIDSGEPPQVDFNRLSSQLVTVNSPPVDHATRFEGNITARIFAGLDVEGSTCRLTNPLPGSPADAETQFTVRVLAGGAEVFQNQTNRDVLEFDWTAPFEFTTSAWNLNFTLSQGDTITMEISIEHNCIIAGGLYFDRYDTATRIELDGVLFSPSLEAKVDQNRAARVEFIPGTVWGDETITKTVVEVAGTYNTWPETVHGNWQEEQRLSHFETPHSTRIGEGNQTVWVWSVNGTLEPGIHMIDICMSLTDLDPNEDCHMVIVHRFMVEEPTTSLGRVGYLVALVPLTTLVWLGSSLRIGTLPLPAYVVLLLMGLAVMIPAASLPEIDIGEVRDESASPAFNLLSHSGKSYSINELLEGNDALVLGVFETDSPNAEQQRKDFLNSIERTESIAYAQLATGEDVRAIDIDEHASLVNGSWPILLDENGAGIASQFPSGASDSILIIDKAGFVSEWVPGSVGSDSIVEMVESASSGSGRSAIDLLFGVLIGAGAILPLILLSLPKNRIEPPDTVMIPGAGILGTIGANAIGFGMIALPISVLALVLRGGLWPFIEIFLAGWMISSAIQMLRNGEIFELNWIVKKIHQKLPENYGKWRNLETFSEDATIGFWFAWISWIVYPLLIPQTVAAPIWTGIVGVLIGVISLILHLLIAGLIGLVLRGVAGIGGNISVSLGRFSAGARPRLWGATSLLLGIWMLAYLVLGQLMARLG
tara:strand:- start:916 stop:3231 length:2316 start_codon:yes stop_codon:yes gene_type:complete